MARDIDRKLRLTAAFLGVVARKDLAAAFRRVNAHTSFDIGRADKWLQGRAQPREFQIYEDWSKVLGLDRPAQWIADCDADALLDEICERHGRDKAALLSSFGSSAARRNGHGSGLDLAGTFACYSHAWSPYFRGRLIRGEFVLSPASGPNRLLATYSEALPTGALKLKGTLAFGNRALHADVRDETSGGQVIAFCLFPASSPASVLGGLMFGTTVIGPDVQPSVTRIAMVRLPTASPRLRLTEAYLPPQASVAADLATLGLQVADSIAVDKCLAEFLGDGSHGGGFDQVPVLSYRELVGLFDRHWFSKDQDAGLIGARDPAPLD